MDKKLRYAAAAVAAIALVGTGIAVGTSLNTGSQGPVQVGQPELDESLSDLEGEGLPDGGESPAAVAAHTLTGVFVLTDSDGLACERVNGENPCSESGMVSPTREEVQSLVRAASGVECQGAGGYDDIRPGSQVVVRGDAGQIVATGSLQAGKLVKRAIMYWPGDVPEDEATFFYPDWDCELRLRVANIPEADFYTVEVSHRGEATYSRAELEAENWRLELTLG